jgi:hypothetical protein
VRHPTELALGVHLLLLAVPHVWEHIKGGLIFITAVSHFHMELQEAACTTASCIQAFVRAAELNQCPIMGESRFLLGDLDLSPDSVQSIIGPFIEK